MPTSTLPFVSEAAVNNFTYTGGSTDYTNLNSDDADTSYGAVNDNPGWVKLDVQQLPGYAVGIVGAVLGYHKDKKITNNFNLDMRIIQAGTDKLADGGAEVRSNAAYAGHQDSWATDVNSNPWTVANFNATKWFYKKTNTGVNTNMRVTYGWMKATWLSASGGFVHLLSQWLPPLLAVASHGLLKSEVAQILASIKHVPSSKEDFTRTLGAFRVRPKFVFLGPLAPCRVSHGVAGSLLLPGAP